MLLDRKWIVQELSPAYPDTVKLDQKFIRLGVHPEDTHVSFIVLFAMLSELLKERRDEVFGLLDQNVPFGTWEMILRSMSSAINLESAAYTLVQTSKIFGLPYEIIIHDQEDSIFFEILIHGKKSTNSVILETIYGRLIWSSFCWFIGREINLREIAIGQFYWKFDHRNDLGHQIQLRSDKTFPSSTIQSADADGFVLNKSELRNRPALRRENKPLVECLKWFATLSYETAVDTQDPQDQLIPVSNLISYNDLERRFRHKGRPMDQLEARIVRAKILLSSSHKSIPEVAFELGFSTEQNFRKIFLQKTGETPSQYRDGHEDQALVSDDHLLDLALKNFK